MMQKKVLISVLTGAMLAMLAVGCGNEKHKTDIIPTPTEAVPSSDERGDGPATPVPTLEPTAEPTSEPTPEPTVEPTAEPTAEPTTDPAAETEVVVGEYMGLTLSNISQETVEEEIRQILKDYVTYHVVEKAAENGDVANINYVGTLDGVAFEGGTEDSEAGYDLLLGSGSFIPGFEEGLIGAVAGEVRELTLIFPEDYQNTELAGQTTVFTVTVNSVKEAVYPELTDDFVNENLYPGATVEEFRQMAYESLNEDNLYGQVLMHLMETSELISYSEKELKEDVSYQVEYYTLYADSYAAYFGSDRATMLYYLFGFESEEKMISYANEYALHQLKTKYVVNEIAGKENILISEEVYNERGLEYAGQYGYEDMASFEADYGAEEIREVILYDLVMDYIISNAVITDAE